jgi:hypothetical protein
MHAAGHVIAAMISTIRAGLRHVKHIAEQLPVECQHIVDKNMCHDIVDNVL